jgi:hypothetical protein
MFIVVMEYLEGGEIKWRGHDGPLLSLEQIRRIIRDVLLGLEYRKSTSFTRFVPKPVPDLDPRLLCV